MAEYIDREAIFPVWISTPSPASIESLCNAINQIPAADVAPVIHGSWKVLDKSRVRHTYYGDRLEMNKIYVCSNCDRQSIIKENYCPNCGAKMEVNK